jgi:hypothetical protein
MAIHDSISSMLKESLVEMFIVAQDCVNFRKDPNIWGSNGCYGYPSAILLFSIADAIGSYVIRGKTRKHFEIFNHKDYYDLNLSASELKLIYENYRCLLTHNAAMPPNTMLNIGKVGDSVLYIKNGVPTVRVAPFLEITRSSLSEFLKNSDKIVNSSQQLIKILNKR